MKHFHLFAYGSYYPGGGLADYKGSFSNLVEAVQYLPTAMHDDSCIARAHIASTKDDGSLQILTYWHPDKGWTGTSS